MAPPPDQLAQDAQEPDPTESTPLLTHAEQTPIASNVTTDVPELPTDPEPPPRKKVFNAQIIILCYASFFEPIAFFSIFPFVNQMIYDTGESSTADVGFYSGIVECCFSLVQMFFMVPWGRLADHPKIGRKPVLVISTFFLSLFTALFGMSKTIWQMMLFRCLSGVFGATTPTIRTMLSENCTPETQAQVFSWYAFTRNFGLFVGPLLGGALADPAHQYKRVFGGVEFFHQFPYAPPAYISGVLGLSSGLLMLFYLDETLKTKVNGADTPVNDSTSPDDNKTMSIWELVKSPGVAYVIYLYGHIMILAFAYTAVMPVFYWEPIEMGGIGFSPLMISLAMALGGMCQAIWLLVFFPWIQKRYSTGAVLRLCANAYPIFYLVTPLLGVMRRHHQEALFWTIGPLSVVLGCGVSMSFTAIQLCLNDVNPHPTTLGTLNSLALAFTSGLRAFSPALFTAILAFGIRKQILQGYFVWIIMAVLAAGFTIAVRFLPANAEGKVKKDDNTQEET